jgi:hypothetical protein
LCFPKNGEICPSISIHFLKIRHLAQDVGSSWSDGQENKMLSQIRKLILVWTLIFLITLIPDWM